MDQFHLFLTRIPNVHTKRVRLRWWPALLIALAAGPLCVAVEMRTVRDYGAVGDGRADDTAAVQRAVDAGGAVTFPAGRYRLTRPVTIDGAKVGPVALNGAGVAVVEMAGPGAAFHLTGTVQRSAAPADFPAEFWAREGSLLVEGLTILGAHADAEGLQITRTMQTVISKCQFRQLKHGIHFTERNRNAIIADCHVYNNRGIGVFIDHVDFHQLNIANSHISYNQGGGVVGIGGAIRNLQVGTCDIEANVGPAVTPTANVFLDSTGGSIGEVEITGCTLQHYPQFPGFANIRYIGHSTAVSFTPEKRHGNLVITGNMINDADVNVHLDGARGAVISGNSIQLGTTHDILIENSSEVVLANNVLDRHPRYNPDRKTNGGPVRQGIVFRQSDDCTLAGLRIKGGKAEAAIDVQGGRGFNINGCSIAEVDGFGLRLRDVSDSLVTANLFEASATGKTVLQIHGGTGNLAERNLTKGLTDIETGSLIKVSP